MAYNVYMAVYGKHRGKLGLKLCAIALLGIGFYGALSQLASAQIPFFAGTTFAFQYELQGHCVRVTVEKRILPPHTVIESRGYSVGCAAIVTSPRALERAVEIRY